jgi:hypothetical protein
MAEPYAMSRVSEGSLRKPPLIRGWKAPPEERQAPD